MPLTIGKATVVVSPGKERKVLVRVVGQEQPMVALESDGPPVLKEGERWHIEAWGEVRKRLSFLHEDMVVLAFQMFMSLVEGKENLVVPDEKAVAVKIAGDLRKLGLNRYIQHVLREHDRELELQRRKCPETWKLFGKVFPTARGVHEPSPPVARRLDALARLVQVALTEMNRDPICVAVCVVGKRIVIATNQLDLAGAKEKQYPSPLELASALFKLQKFGGHVGTPLLVAMETGIETSLLVAPEQVTELQQDRVAIDSEKVITWLTEDLGIKDAEALAKCIEYVPKLGIHAEMALLVWLLTDKGGPLLLKSLEKIPCTSLWDEGLAKELSLGRREDVVLPKDSMLLGPLNFGISFLCCPHCAYTLHEYNRYCTQSRKELCRIGVRGFHTVDKGGWSFFFSQQDMKQNVMKVLKGRDLGPLLEFMGVLVPLGKAIRADLKKVDSPTVPSTQGRGRYVSTIALRAGRSPSPPRSRHKKVEREESRFLEFKEPDRRCRTCRKLATKRCSRCKVAYYCDESCQRVDWPEHKKFCHA